MSGIPRGVRQRLKSAGRRWRRNPSLGRSRTELLRPAIFGLADGCMSLLGVILYLHGAIPLVVFMSALMGGISSAFSMAGGEFMSDDSHVLPSIIMGAATGIGGILPALPYAFLAGTPAFALCMAVVLAIGGLVAWLRAQASREHGKLYTVLVTFLILGAIFGIVMGCTAIFPTPG